MLDRDAAMPLYHQIFLQLRDEILSGERPHGSTLPTEQELSALYGVSRITARRVPNDLAQQHYVERKRRLGTRVTFQSPAKPIEANIDQSSPAADVEHDVADLGSRPQVFRGDVRAAEHHPHMRPGEPPRTTGSRNGRIALATALWRPLRQSPPAKVASPRRANGNIGRSSCTAP